MALVDYIVVSVYLAGILVMGLLKLARKPLPTDFYLAGRRMGSFVIGLSTMATVFSAVNFIAFSTEIFSNGLYVLMVIPAFLLVAVPVVQRIIPFYHGLKLTSVYELLEKAFDGRVRALAACIFILWRIAWAALVLYALSLITGRLTGLNPYLIIVVLGIITTLYTSTGGMRTVMMTDVVQVLILFAAIAVALSVTTGMFSSMPGVMESVRSLALLKPFSPPDKTVFSPDPTIRMTLWSCILGGFVAFLSRYGTDQMVVQRYFTAKTLKAAKKGFLINLAVHVFALACLALFGLTLRHWSVLNAPVQTGPGALAWFISMLPMGLSGLLVTAMLASTMSSVDSGIHSATTAFLHDIRKSGAKPAGADNGTRSSSAASAAAAFVLGLLVIVLACLVGRLGTIFEVANKVINALGAPLLALFAASLKSNWRNSMNSSGVLWGGFLGIVSSTAVSLLLDNLAIHYYALVNFLLTLLFCYIASRLFGAAGNQKAAL